MIECISCQMFHSLTYEVLGGGARSLQVLDNPGQVCRDLGSQAAVQGLIRGQVGRHGDADGRGAECQEPDPSF